MGASFDVAFDTRNIETMNDVTNKPSFVTNDNATHAAVGITASVAEVSATANMLSRTMDGDISAKVEGQIDGSSLRKSLDAEVKPNSSVNGVSVESVRGSGTAEVDRGLVDQLVKKGEIDRGVLEKITGGRELDPGLVDRLVVDGEVDRGVLDQLMGNGDPVVKPQEGISVESVRGSGTAELDPGLVDQLVKKGEIDRGVLEKITGGRELDPGLVDRLVVDGEVDRGVLDQLMGNGDPVVKPQEGISVESVRGSGTAEAADGALEQATKTATGGAGASIAMLGADAPGAKNISESASDSLIKSVVDETGAKPVTDNAASVIAKNMADEASSKSIVNSASDSIEKSIVDGMDDGASGSLTKGIVDASSEQSVTDSAASSIHKTTVSGTSTNQVSVDLGTPTPEQFRQFRDVYLKSNAYSDQANFVEYMLNMPKSDCKELMQNPYFQQFIDLSTDEWDALSSFTGNAYVGINQSIRMDDISDYVRGLSESIDRAMKSSGGLSDARTLYRAVDVSGMANSNLGFLFDGVDLENPKQVYAALKSMEGLSMVDPAYMSSSMSKDVISKFGNVQFEIDAPKGLNGIDIRFLSSNIGEEEFTMARGTKLDIQSVAMSFADDGAPIYTIKGTASNQLDVDLNVGNRGKTIGQVAIDFMDEDIERELKWFERSFQENKEYLSRQLGREASFEEIMSLDQNNPLFEFEKKAYEEFISNPDQFFLEWEKGLINELKAGNTISFDDYMNAGGNSFYKRLRDYYDLRDIVAVLRESVN